MIITDCEMSGLEANVHSIVSIGAVDFEEPSRRFYEECRIFYGAHVMDEALAINGFTEKEINDPLKQTEGGLVERFFKWALESKNHTIAGQNPSTDVDFLRTAAHRAHVNFPLAYRSLDLHSMCFLHMTEKGITPPTEKGRSALNSDTIMKYVGIPDEPRPHNALNGALYEAEAFSRLLYNKNLLPEFAKHPIPWKN